MRDQLRSAWADILQTAVDNDTDFFDAGGTSLAAMQIVARLDAVYGTQVPLRMIFDHPRFDDFVNAAAATLQRGTT